MLHGKHTRYTLGVFCYASVIFIVAPPTPDPKQAKCWRNSTTTRLIGRWMMRRWKSQRTWLTQWSRLWNLRPERPLSRMSPNKRHSIPGMCTLAWNQQVSQSYRRSLVFSYHTMRPQPSGTVHTHMKVELGILTGPLPGAQVSGQNGRPFFKPWSLCGTRMYRGPGHGKSHLAALEAAIKDSVWTGLLPTWHTSRHWRNKPSRLWESREENCFWNGGALRDGLYNWNRWNNSSWKPCPLICIFHFFVERRKRVQITLTCIPLQVQNMHVWC